MLLVRFSALILFFLIARAGDERIVFYQRNDPPQIPPTFQSIRLLDPIGQEFRSAEGEFNRIEIFLADFDEDGHAGAQLAIAIRRGAIDGPIEARSGVLTLPDEFEGVGRFDFPTPVKLPHGALYVFELILDQGDNWSVCAGDDTYSGGRQVIRGVPRDDSDLWFRISSSMRPPSPSADRRFRLLAR